jgi:hypothetical protein
MIERSFGGRGWRDGVALSPSPLFSIAPGQKINLVLICVMARLSPYFVMTRIGRRGSAAPESRMTVQAGCCSDAASADPTRSRFKAA